MRLNDDNCREFETRIKNALLLCAQSYIMYKVKVLATLSYRKCMLSLFSIRVAKEDDEIGEDGEFICEN